MKLRMALVAAIGVVAGAAHADPVSQSATATATIVSPNAVNKTRDLVFGTIARPTTGTSTIKVTSTAASQTPTVTGGNASIPTSGLATAATFRLVGADGQHFSVGATSLTFTTPSALAGSGAETPATSTGDIPVAGANIPPAGFVDVYVGGHFDITPSTALNTYTGALNLTINFD